MDIFLVLFLFFLVSKLSEKSKNAPRRTLPRTCLHVPWKHVRMCLGGTQPGGGAAYMRHTASSQHVAISGIVDQLLEKKGPNFRAIFSTKLKNFSTGLFDIRIVGAAR